jgi:hypothetical protein
MYKFVLIVLLFSIINADKNFLGETIKIEHGEEYLFWGGFINGTQIFHHLNKGEACLSIIPILHDDWVHIINLIDELETQHDFFKVVHAIINKLEDIYRKMKTVEQPCSDMMKDAAHRLAELSHYFSHQWIEKMFIHAYVSINDIKLRYQIFKSAYYNSDYCNAGYALGELTRFTLFWDFQPQVFNNLFMLLN